MSLFILVFVGCQSTLQILSITYYIVFFLILIVEKHAPLSLHCDLVYYADNYHYR